MLTWHLNILNSQDFKIQMDGSKFYCFNHDNCQNVDFLTWFMVNICDFWAYPLGKKTVTMFHVFSFDTNELLIRYGLRKMSKSGDNLQYDVLNVSQFGNSSTLW